MKAESTSHPDSGAEHGIGHVRLVDVVQVEAADEGERLHGLDVAAAEGVDGQVLHGAVVVVDVVVIVGFHADDAAHGKDHVEQGEPRAVEALTFEVICAESGLIEHGDKDVDPLEVGVDEGLAFPGPGDALAVLWRGTVLLPNGKVLGDLCRVEGGSELGAQGRLNLEHAHEGGLDGGGAEVGGLAVDGEGESVDVVGLDRDGVAAAALLIPLNIAAGHLLKAGEALLRDGDGGAQRALHVLGDGRGL